MKEREIDLGDLPEGWTTELIRGRLIVLTRKEAPGAWPNGTRIVKMDRRPGDTHAVGAQARVIGSACAPDGEYGYFVEWDDAPGIPVLVRTEGGRIAKVKK